jgi:hypothetical protein
MFESFLISYLKKRLEDYIDNLDNISLGVKIIDLLILI